MNEIKPLNNYIYSSYKSKWHVKMMSETTKVEYVNKKKNLPPSPGGDTSKSLSA